MQLPHRLLIVRRDRRETLRAILASPERWPDGTAVMLDRRQAERRVRRQRIGVERRERPRRAEPDAMWHSHGFIRVEVATVPTQAVLLPAPRLPVGRG